MRFLVAPRRDHTAGWMRFALLASSVAKSFVPPKTLRRLHLSSYAASSPMAASGCMRFALLASTVAKSFVPPKTLGRLHLSSYAASLLASAVAKSFVPPKTLRRLHLSSHAASSPMAASEESLRLALAEKQAAVDAQAEVVRTLKARIDAAVKSLKALKVEARAAARQLQAAVSRNDNAPAAGSREAFRQAVVNTLERRLFYIPSFKTYCGVTGLYDYGPPGCAVKSNVLTFWRQHFVLEENMLEVDCPCFTPEVVLKASGHVDKFTDLMVKDEKTGTCYRADHLLKDYCKEKLEKDLTISSEKAAELKHVLAMLDDFSAEELGAKLKDYGITAPDT